MRALAIERFGHDIIAAAFPTLSFQRFCQQRVMAKHRKIPWYFTYEEWFNAWFESGFYEQRGRMKADYCMCRFGDTGDYEPSNVFFQTVSENSRQNALAGKGRHHAKQRDR